MRRIGPQQGVSGYHLARWRGLTGRPRAFFLPAPDRNVPRSSQTGPYRHSWPPVTLSCRPGRLSSATTGRCRGHSGGPAIVGSRAVSGSNPMGPSTRTSEQGGSGWCIARSRSSSRARATAWTAPGAATSGNCRSPRRTRNEAESARGRGVSRHHLARWRGLTQAVLARFLARHRTEMCPEARRPGRFAIPGPPSLSCRPWSAVLRHHRPMSRRTPPAFRLSSVQELSPARIRYQGVPEQGGQG